MPLPPSTVPLPPLPLAPAPARGIESRFRSAAGRSASHPTQRPAPAPPAPAVRRGRPRIPGATSHRARETFARLTPAHVTLRVLPGVHSLRGCALFRTIHRILAGTSSAAFGLVDYSVQRNHFHFNVEAVSNVALSRGVQSLAIRLARAINRRMGRRGKVFAQRFFSRVLRTPRDARNARRYVLNNARRHARGAVRNHTDWRDPCSSAPFFDHWSIPPGTPRAPPTQHDCALARLPSAAASPRTYLLREGWKAAGTLILTDCPGPP